MDDQQLAELIRASNGRITIEDLKLLQRVCLQYKPKKILEIGSADGGSSVILGLAAKAESGYLYCIEPHPKGKMRANMKQHGLLDHINYRIIPCPSPWVELNVISHDIDLLFIDGSHELRWCLVDYHYWMPFVNHGGIIIFHDTSGGCQEDKRQPGYGKPGYVPLVQRAINIIMETDSEILTLIDECDAIRGGCKAYQKL